MGKTFIQTIGLTTMALFLIVTAIMPKLLETLNLFGELQWLVWKPFFVFMFIGGTIAIIEIVSQQKVIENLEALGIALSALLIGTTNIIGVFVVPLNYLNFAGIILAGFIASIQFIYFFKHWQYSKPTKTESFAGLRIVTERKRPSIYGGN